MLLWILIKTLKFVNNIKPNLITIALIAVCALACSPEKKGSSEVESPTVETDSACYLYVNGLDSIKLAIVRDHERVTGRMAYLFYEKDKSWGTVDGSFRGDTLFVDYSFFAEGTHSFRELAFLKRNGAFVLGTGEIRNSGNRDVFKDPHNIDFSGKVVLQPVPCP